MKFGLRLLDVAALCISGCVLALIGFAANEASASLGMFSQSYRWTGILTWTLPSLGWQAFGLVALLRYRRDARRGLLVARAWMAIPGTLVDLFGITIFLLVRGWGPPSPSELASEHIAGGYCIADLAASMFVVAGAIATRSRRDSKGA